MSTTCHDTPLYLAADIKAWEQRWFAQGNCSLGLMQQASLAVAHWLDTYLNQPAKHPHPHRRPKQTRHVVILCGTGNNGGDGYYTALYLHELGYQVTVIALGEPKTADAKQAHAELSAHLPITDVQTVDWHSLHADVYVDALFGNGLDRPLSDEVIKLLNLMQQKSGLKIALDIPTGLHPDTGVPMPTAWRADVTLCLMGLKLGLTTAQGRTYAGKCVLLPLIPPDSLLTPCAYLTTTLPQLPPKATHSHKGDHGHVYVIGGSASMGGAVIMAGEAALAMGAGKVTVLCHPAHHSAVLARSPNIMVGNIAQLSDPAWQAGLDVGDVLVFGMGLGRDDWARRWCDAFSGLIGQGLGNQVVLDADALYWLALNPQHLPSNITLTPHSGEAARLLRTTAESVEQDRPLAIRSLCAQYGGQWVLKGAGTLSLSQHYTFNPSLAVLQVCHFGNANMASAGMGDVLSGVIAGLYARYGQAIRLADCVAIHAYAGDLLAQRGNVQAHLMPPLLATLVSQLSSKSNNAQTTC